MSGNDFSTETCSCNPILYDKIRQAKRLCERCVLDILAKQTILNIFQRFRHSVQQVQYILQGKYPQVEVSRIMEICE